VPVNRKELVLNRIIEVLDEVEGVADVDGESSVFRNRRSIEGIKRPAIIVLDGNMRIRPNTTQGRGTNRNFMDDAENRIAPCEMVLTPEIFLILDLAPDQDNLDEDGMNQGAKLSEFETRILAKLMFDNELWELLGGGDNGMIEYRGIETDMRSGSNMEGQMQLDVAFTFPFDPDELR